MESVNARSKGPPGPPLHRKDEEEVLPQCAWNEPDGIDIMIA